MVATLRAHQALLITVLSGAALFLSSCAGSSEPAAPSEAVTSEDGGTAPPSESTEAGSEVNEEFVGRWSSDEKGEPHLELKDDGTVTGSDGCNGISTSYTVEGDTVTIAPFVSTLRACSGVDTWLHDVATLTVDGDETTVFNHGGEEIGTLTKE